MGVSKKGCVVSVLVVLMLLAVTATVWAQAVASISGRAADASGAVIGGVHITVRNLETGETRITTTDDTGAV